MSENCNSDCNNCAADCSSRQPSQTHDFREPLHALSSVKKVIGVVSGKGGVGKSLTSALLAVSLNRMGYTTAILDADITGPSIPRLFGLHEKATGTENGLFPVVTKTGIQVMSINLLLENETDPVVWRGPVIGGTVKQFWQDVIWKDVDFMFVDMPPGTGDVPLTVFQIMPIDGIVVVTTPQELVKTIVAKAVKMAELMNVPILGLVENMSYLNCPDCDTIIEPFGTSKAEETAREFNIPLLARLPIQPALAQCADQGVIELFEGDWMENAAIAIENRIK